MKKKIFLLTLCVSSLFSFNKLVLAAETSEMEDVLHSSSNLYGRISAGISSPVVPPLFNFGDIIYNGEEQQIQIDPTSINDRTSKISFLDERGYIATSRSTGTTPINNEEMAELDVIGNVIPQVTVAVEDVPEWLQAATIGFNVVSNQVDKTDLETDEGIITLDGIPREALTFKADFNSSNEAGTHLPSEETGYIAQGSDVKRYSLTNIKLNIPAELTLPGGKQTIDLKIKWDLAYTP